MQLNEEKKSLYNSVPKILNDITNLYVYIFVLTNLCLLIVFLWKSKGRIKNK